MSISSKHTAPICLFPQLTLYLPVYIVAYRDGQRDSSYPVLMGQKIKNYIYTEKIATLYLRTSRQAFCPHGPMLRFTACWFRISSIFYRTLSTLFSISPPFRAIQETRPLNNFLLFTYPGLFPPLPPLFICPPAGILLLARQHKLQCHFWFSAKFICMGNQKNRLTTIETLSHLGRKIWLPPQLPYT